MKRNTNPFSLMAIAALKAKTANKRKQALILHAQGLDLEAIATRLGISPRTVRRYLDGLLVDRRFKKRDSDA